MSFPKNFIDLEFANVVNVEIVDDVEVVLYEVYTKNDFVVLNVIRLNVALINKKIVDITVLDKCQFLVDMNITDVDIINVIL